MTSRRVLVGLLLPALLLTACGISREDAAIVEPAVAVTTDPVLVAGVTSAFATYRSGIERGDAEAVLTVLDDSSIEAMAVSPASEDVALGVVLDPATRSPTPLRWRFHQEEEWRFDLADAHRLLSQTIDNSARRAGVGVDDLVAATVVDLSGEPADTVEALYTEPPASRVHVPRG